MPRNPQTPPFSSHDRGRLEEFLDGFLPSDIREYSGEIDGLQTDVERTTVDNKVLVKSESDLPDPVNGEIQLEDNTAYEFMGFVGSNNSLRLNNISPLLGKHGGLDGFIHTGGEDAIIGDGSNFFARDMYLHAPGGTALNLSADKTKDMLVESISISDAGGMGELASLGQIDGFRVPSFKSCNFEDFQSGLTFAGDSDKIFIEGCPFRGVNSTGVVAMRLASNATTGVLDILNCYFKDFEPDTEALRVDSSSTITTVAQYRGNTHGSTVTEENILTGEASVSQKGYRVSDSFPLRDSTVFGSYSLDATTTTTINTQASSRTDETAYEKVEGTMTTGEVERVIFQNNALTHDSIRDRGVEVSGTGSLGTGNSDNISLAWFKNGSLLGGSENVLQMNGQAGGVDKQLTTGTSDPEAKEGDEYDIRVANLSSTTDVTFGFLNARLSSV